MSCSRTKTQSSTLPLSHRAPMQSLYNAPCYNTDFDTTTRASPVFTVCHQVISLLYSLFQYIIIDGMLYSWTCPCGYNTVIFRNHGGILQKIIGKCPWNGYFLIQSTLDTSNFKGLSKCRVISSSRQPNHDV